MPPNSIVTRATWHGGLSVPCPSFRIGSSLQRGRAWQRDHTLQREYTLQRDDTIGIDMAHLWNRDEVLAGLASREDSYLRPPLPLEDALAFERRNGIILPESYRSFITEVGDGGAGPENGLWPLHRSARWTGREPAYGPGYLARPFPYTRRVSAESFEAMDDVEDYEDALTGSLIIAEIGCGAFIRLVATGEASGQAWRDTVDQGGALTPGPDFGEWYLRWLRPGERTTGGRQRLVGWHSQSLRWQGGSSE
ncbi:SMI1/KNR4 family protein [Actinomadura sp. 9N407]|uniref:SMI1/KNR4 family protein n=1 Tax=Actinomadura sp. 9N407 TaxID=3375154 RepID=UPI00379C7239